MNAFLDIRKQLQVSQAEMAAALGISQGNVSFYETGKQNVPPPVAAKLIEFARSKGLAITFDSVYSPLLETPTDTPRAAA